MAPDARLTSRTGPFRKADRVRKRPEFQAAYGRGNPVFTAKLVFYASPGDGAACRFGCTVPKVVGGAVVRNRVKRILRESFRLTRGQFPAGCVLIVNAKRSAADLSLEDSLRAFGDVARRLEREGYPPCGH
jgi:ribonuclease P protein component